MCKVFNASTSAKRGSATPAQVRKVVFNASTSVERGFATLTQVQKVVFNTSRIVKSGFQHQHMCAKWFSMPAQVWKVVLQH